jgi:hypothetical protein
MRKRSSSLGGCLHMSSCRRWNNLRSAPSARRTKRTIIWDAAACCAAAAVVLPRGEEASPLTASLQSFPAQSTFAIIVIKRICLSHLARPPFPFPSRRAPFRDPRALWLKLHLPVNYHCRSIFRRQPPRDWDSLIQRGRKKTKGKRKPKKSEKRTHVLINFRDLRISLPISCPRRHVG